MNNPGGFSSMFDLKKLNYKDPILLSCTDGVGTKLKLAIDHRNFDFLGFDLVAMCVNDLLANGGEPLFFLDYIASSKINKNQFLRLITSINLACKEAGCSLVGGETAEMPGIYSKNKFDLAGFSVGIVSKKKILGKNKVKKNDVILAIPSSGIHSNGYSLIRSILKNKKISPKLKNQLIKPTKIYCKEILQLVNGNLINAAAHITGGGLIENLQRSIPDDLSMNIENVGETHSFTSFYLDPPSRHTHKYSARPVRPRFRILGVGGALARPLPSAPQPPNLLKPPASSRALLPELPKLTEKTRPNRQTR